MSTAASNKMLVHCAAEAGARVELLMNRKCCKDHFVSRRARWLENEGDIKCLRRLLLIALTVYQQLLMFTMKSMATQKAKRVTVKRILTRSSLVKQTLLKITSTFLA
jgi:hypothetical protein